MSKSPETEWPGEWPMRVHVLHPEVKTYGDMVTAPERREYVRADKVLALVEACKAWGMHLEMEDVTAADQFREIRAAIAALDVKP